MKIVLEVADDNLGEWNPKLFTDDKKAEKYFLAVIKENVEVKAGWEAEALKEGKCEDGCGWSVYLMEPEEMK